MSFLQCSAPQPPFTQGKGRNPLSCLQCPFTICLPHSHLSCSCSVPFHSFWLINTVASLVICKHAASVHLGDFAPLLQLSEMLLSPDTLMANFLAFLRSMFKHHLLYQACPKHPVLHALSLTPVLSVTLTLFHLIHWHCCTHFLFIICHLHTPTRI